LPVEDFTKSAPAAIAASASARTAESLNRARLDDRLPDRVPGRCSGRRKLATQRIPFVQQEASDRHVDLVGPGSDGVLDLVEAVAELGVRDREPARRGRNVDR
jgi:hypothetical protein